MLRCLQIFYNAVLVIFQVMILCFAVFFGDWLPSQFTSGFGDLSTHDSSLYTFNTLDSYASETCKLDLGIVILDKLELLVVVLTMPKRYKEEATSLFD